MKLSPAQFAALQELWIQELGEELTPIKAELYGEKILALVALVARSKTMSRRGSSKTILNEVKNA